MTITTWMMMMMTQLPLSPCHLCQWHNHDHSASTQSPHHSATCINGVTITTWMMMMMMMTMTQSPPSIDSVTTTTASMQHPHHTSMVDHHHPT